MDAISSTKDALDLLTPAWQLVGGVAFYSALEVCAEVAEGSANPDDATVAFLASAKVAHVVYDLEPPVDHSSTKLNRQPERLVKRSTHSEEEDIAMPRTDENDTRKAADQEAERKRLAEQQPEGDKKAVEEPESAKPQLEGGKIIGNV